MPQTFYIENDEEIISIIGRLRKSSSQENFFVFPKRALVLQSIVNLRLLQREAEKLGKKIVIVTQDEEGKKLAEKAGMETESYSDDFSARASHVEIEEPKVVERKVVTPSEISIPRSQDLGSSDFYSSPQLTPPLSQNVSEAQGRSLRIRNASPEKLTSLNSLRGENQTPSPEAAQPTREVPKPLFHPSVSLGAAAPSSPTPVPPRPQVSGMQNNMPVPKPMQQATPSYDTQAPSKPMNETGQLSREERLKNFFAPSPDGSRTASPVTSSRPTLARPVQKTPAPTPVVNKRASHVFLILGGISLLSLVGVGLFLFLPKAEVHVVPHKLMRSTDQQFDGRSLGDMSAESTVPVRIIEKEQNVTVSAEATGTAPGSAQKARGSVVISNEFSADSQTLVATTRFESPDGKIFRLLEGVTVPGMTNGQPGTVTAAVIADQTGSEYNIAPTTFTIPGFKGSPKYTKFTAKSTKAMAGGGDATGGDISVISKSDLDKAEKDAKEKAKNDYLSSVSGELMPEEKVLEEVMEFTPENQSTLPVVGTPARSFDYQVTYKVKAFIFSEKVVKEKISAQLNQKVGDISFQPTSITLTYGESIPNYNEGTLRLKTHASIVLESVINREQITEEMLGKDEGEIDALLNSHPEIKKVQIEIKPQWFSSAIPNSKDRVIVTVEPGEE